MSLRRCLPRVLFGLLALLTLANLVPAQNPVADPADLLPASTLAWAEVRHPAKLAQELRALTKGTALEDLPQRLAKMRAEFPNREFFGFSEITGMIGLMGSPEMLAEGGRFRGAAVGVTGFSKEGFPEIVGLVLAGESPYPGLVMRAQISFEGTRLIQEVEGVAIYRQAWQRFDRDPKGDGKVTYEENGPHMVYLPGVLAFTSSKESAGDVIRRYKGKTKEAALSSTPAFQANAALRDRPGIFLTSDIAAFVPQMDVAAKAIGPQVKTPWDQLKLLIEPRAMQRLDASLSLKDGNLDLTGNLKLDTKFTSPVLDMIPTKPLQYGSLAGFSAKALGTTTLGVEDPDARMKMILKTADILAESFGTLEDELPSKLLPGIETLLGFQLGKDVLGRIREVTLGFDGRNPLPFYAVQATNEEAAKYLIEKAIPKLIAVGSNGRDEVHREENKEGDLHVCKAGFVAARVGDVILVGFNRDDMKAHLSDLQVKGLWKTDARHTTALKSLGEAGLVGTFSLRSMMVPFLAGMGREEPKPDTQPGRALHTIAKAVDELPPVVLGLTREKESYRLHARLDGLRGTLPKLIDTIILQSIEMEKERRKQRKGN